LQWSVIERWIERQDAAYVRQEARKEALRLWYEHPHSLDPDPSGVIKYAEDYGVWLVPEYTLSRVR
jgi:hypothetical protein